ncbi:tetraspanin-8-like [Magnolia sinica]|uniref:tetraspanin-8-like n=1 Tax=Magnolia sinica TaxID=86752 RepID=UPI00265A3D77|nr:tetraspanin-8-like [Magnolia sinica]
MIRISNNLIGVLNILTIILSIPLFISAIYVSHHSNSQCDRFIRVPLLVLAILLFFISLCGFIGSCCRVTFFLWIYLFIMFLLILGLMGFTVFAFVITNKGAGEVISGRGYKEYRLGNYSLWLQKRVRDERNWLKIKSCLSEAKVCGSLGRGAVYEKAAEFYKMNLTPIQSGCCKPPSYCGFIYQNATFWSQPKSGVKSNEKDCLTWSNDQNRLCFECESCKAGVLANLKHDWRKVAIVNVSVLVFVIIIYSIGCCAFRNNRYDTGHKTRAYP